MIMEQLRYAYDYLSGRQRAYIVTFRAPGARRVLADLAKFCRANESTFDEDHRVHAVLEGRREVWLRISQHLNLSPEELWRIYNPATPLTED